MSMSANAFLSSIARKFESMVRYEDPELHKVVLAEVPVTVLEYRAQERMRMLQKQVKQDDNGDINISIQELLLLEVLAWFKNNWMEWVDTPDCDICDSNTKYSHSSQDVSLLRTTGADRIEMFRCTDPKCGHMTSFERHSDPSRAWHNRQGRCGEFATAFTLLCRAFRWEARLICDSTDHAWTEVYSIAQQRWIHADPCENICDQPLIYETGWGKQLSYIIAYAHDDLQDVTWRYSASHNDILKNRNICSERDLLDLLVNLRELKQNRFSYPRKKYLAKRTTMELVELMTEKKTTEADKQGRISGSLSWRLQRGETKISIQKTWVPIPQELSAMTIRYSVVRDCYERVSDDDGKITEVVEKWENGVFNASGMFRKEEQDWKMVYLCREESATEGKILWRFSAGTGKIIDKVSVHIDSTTFENGQVFLTLTGADKTLLFPNAVDISTEELKGSPSVTVTAAVSGGRGDCAWQHAQLFRQTLSPNNEFPFSVTITFIEY